METKNITLSHTDLLLLETLMMRQGRIVSFEQIRELYKEAVSRQAVKQRVARLARAGWLVRLKKGVYLVNTDISTLGVGELSEYVISHALKQDAYISCEAALQYHRLFDQLLARIDAITTRTARAYTVGETSYTFATIKRDLYFGFTTEAIGAFAFQMAEPEKALLDMLYLRVGDYTVSLVLEKLHDYSTLLDFPKLQAYTQRYSLGMVRKVGFLLDQVGIDTTALFSQANVKQNSYNKLGHTTDQFNAKWRLYYDTHLIGQTTAAAD